MPMIFQKTRSTASNVSPLSVAAMHRSDPTGRLLIRASNVGIVTASGDKTVDGFIDPNSAALYQRRSGTGNRHVKLLTIGGVKVVEGMPPVSGNNGYDLPPSFFHAKDIISFTALYRYPDWTYNVTQDRAYLTIASVPSDVEDAQFGLFMTPAAMTGAVRREDGDAVTTVRYDHPGGVTTRWIAPLFVADFAAGTMTLKDLLQPGTPAETATIPGPLGPTDSLCTLARMFRRQADRDDAFYGQAEGMEFWSSAPTILDEAVLRIRFMALVARMDAAEA